MWVFSESAMRVRPISHIMRSKGNWKQRTMQPDGSEMAATVWQMASLWLWSFMACGWGIQSRVAVTFVPLLTGLWHFMPEWLRLTFQARQHEIWTMKASQALVIVHKWSNCWHGWKCVYQQHNSCEGMQWHTFTFPNCYRDTNRQLLQATFSMLLWKQIFIFD